MQKISRSLYLDAKQGIMIGFFIYRNIILKMF